MPTEFTEELFFQTLIQAIVFLALSLVFLWTAWARGFFKRPLIDSPYLPIMAALLSFVIYLACFFFLSDFLSLLIYQFTSWQSINLQITVGLITSLVAIVLIYFSLRLWGKSLTSRIIKDYTLSPAPSVIADLRTGLIGLILSWPIIFCVTAIIELIMYSIVGPFDLEQMAVKLFRELIGSPYALVMAFIMIVIVAPLTEELLFRGILQTTLKSRMKTSWAIVFSALCFSLAHFLPSQSYTNIPLLASIFILGLFLGHVYDKQRSLIAPIVLHVTFNLVSVIRILFSV